MHATVFQVFFTAGMRTILTYGVATLRYKSSLNVTETHPSIEGVTKALHIPFMPLIFKGMSQTQWQKWVTEQMARQGWETQAAASRASGLPPASISQWLNPNRTQKPNIENCRLAAAAFGVPILRALVAAEHITPEEAGMKPTGETTLREARTREVLLELQMRVSEMEKELESCREGQEPEEPQDWTHGSNPVFAEPNGSKRSKSPR